MVNISISSNLLILVSCLILFSIIGLIVYIIYSDKIVDQDEIDELIDDIVKAKPRDEEVKVKQIEPIKEPSKLNLEQMLNDMQTNLDKKQEKTIELYEKEQDENAIISIKELEKFKNNIEAYEKDQEDKAIINYNELSGVDSIQKLEEKEELIKTPVKKAIAKIETNDSHKKFHNTDFISPIFGKMNNEIDYPKIRAYDRTADLDFNEYFGQDMSNHQLEQSIDVRPLSDEIRRNTEFLNALKEFRSNLE